MRQLLFFFLVSSVSTRLATAQVQPTVTLAAPPADSLNRPRTHYLALDVQGLFKTRRYRYYVGEPMRFRARGERYNALLYAVTDSTFSILQTNEVMNRSEAINFRPGEVQTIYRSRRIAWLTAGSVAFPIAGLTYIIADYVNPRDLAGNGRYIFDPHSLIPGGALIALGAAGYALSRPHYTLNKKHQLRILWVY